MIFKQTVPLISIPFFSESQGNMMLGTSFRILPNNTLLQLGRSIIPYYNASSITSLENLRRTVPIWLSIKGQAYAEGSYYCDNYQQLGFDSDIYSQFILRDGILRFYTRELNGS